jgi:hypothetical protein
MVGGHHHGHHEYYGGFSLTIYFMANFSNAKLINYAYNKLGANR